VLWAFAFAKPLFDVLEDAPDFFVARGNTSADILVFSIGFTLLPPTALALVELAVARLPELRRSLHLLFVGGLFAAFAVQVLDDAVGGSGQLLVALAALLGAGAAWAYARTRLVPSALTVLGPAPLLFLFLFLVTSPVSKLVLPQGDAQAADAHVRSDTPVVMVVFDEFDPNMLMDARQRIDRTRYPNFAALAGDSTWYRHATTVNSQTTMAVPALMSGRRPRPGMVPVTADYPNSLPTLLAHSHELNVKETATQVCPESLCGEREREPVVDRLRSLTNDLGIVSLHLVAPSRLEHRLPAVDKTFGNFGGGAKDTPNAVPPKQVDVPLSALTNRPTTFDGLLRGIHPQRDRPTLSFLHIALPHIPWQYLPGGQQYINAGPDYPGLEDERWSADPVTAQLGLQRHLLQVGFADRLIGRLVARLRAAGIYRRALVVVTADHGVSYRAGQPRRAPVAGNGSDIAAVPLLIKYPDRPGGRVDDSFVRTIDVVPTIAHALGVDLPWSAEGRPIGAPGSGSQQVEVRAGASGTVLTLAFPDFVREQRAGLRRMVGLFGSDDGDGRLYANGPNWDLLGRPARQLGRAAATGGRLEFDSTSGLDDFHPGARLVPSFLSGRITGGVDAGASLAVAVNGTIRSVTRSFTDRGELRMAAVVPVSAFRPGANSVDVFAVDGSGSARRLASLATERPSVYRLAERDGRTTIEAKGRELQVRPGKLQGYVDSLVVDDQGARLGGWAVDPAAHRAAERILVFSDGRLVAQGEPTVVRPDIGKTFGPAAARSGFDVRWASRGAKAHDLRAFAVLGDTATELPRWKG
jgi:hypothetical protein